MILIFFNPKVYEKAVTDKCYTSLKKTFILLK